MLSRIALGLALLLCGGSFCRADEPAPENKAAGITVTVKYPAKEPFDNVAKTLNKLKEVGLTEIKLAETDNDFPSMIIAVEKGASSKTVAALVAALLDLGITNIKIEPKK